MECIKYNAFIDKLKPKSKTKTKSLFEWRSPSKANKKKLIIVYAEGFVKLCNTRSASDYNYFINSHNYSYSYYYS